MGQGKPKAKIDETFRKRIEALENSARRAADQYKNNNTYTSWGRPPGYETRDMSDVPGLHMPAWDRDSINRLYSEELLGQPGAESGTSGDLIAMKWQADFLAVEERAFRTRHASRARCLAHMHGRLDGHGQAGKSVFSFLRDGIQNMIDLGGSHGS